MNQQKAKLLVVMVLKPPSSSIFLNISGLWVELREVKGQLRELLGDWEHPMVNPET